MFGDHLPGMDPAGTFTLTAIVGGAVLVALMVLCAAGAVAQRRANRERAALDAYLADLAAVERATGVGPQMADARFRSGWTLSAAGWVEPEFVLGARPRDVDPEASL
jgi:hypothetical protein